MVINKLHLAEFYAANNDTLEALNCVNASYRLANEIHNNRDKLASLKLLSKIDNLNSETYLKTYINLKDSLEIEERRIRDKYTRIRYETDEYVERTRLLSQQKKWIIAASAVALLVMLLLYILRRQHSKNKELRFETEQQRYSEEIYELMLQQKERLEEGRIQERNRISEELHDGVLGKLFGARMGMGFLDVKGDDQTLNKHQELIDELQEIEKEIRVISHELKNDQQTSKIDLISIVENLMQIQSKIGDFQYNITNDETIPWDKISKKIKLNVYRIIQEAVHNINKYASAKNVNIDFKNSDKILILTVKDDGVGFDTSTNKRGIGLLNIDSRAKKIHAECSISSEIGIGTQLRLWIKI